MGKTLEDACLAYFWIYDLRHTLASRLTQAGVPPIFVAQIIGHSSPSILSTHARAIDEFKGRNPQAGKPARRQDKNGCLTVPSSGHDNNITIRFLECFGMSSHSGRDSQPDAGRAFRWQILDRRACRTHRQVKALSPHRRFVIALHSPVRITETGLRMCPPEKGRQIDAIRSRPVRSL
jgi:hypothetical protein